MRCVQIQADVLSITHLGGRTLNPLVSSVHLRTRTVIGRTVSTIRLPSGVAAAGPCQSDRRAWTRSAAMGRNASSRSWTPGQVGPVLHPRPHRILSWHVCVMIGV